MATINEKTSKIIFDNADKHVAWTNAPKIIDAENDQYRVCLYCQFPMKKSKYVDDHHKKSDYETWTIDLINLKKPKLVDKNLLAIHAKCFGNRQNDNEKHRLKKYTKTKWKMPQNISNK